MLALQKPDGQDKSHERHAVPELEELEDHIHQASDQEVRSDCNPCQPDLDVVPLPCSCEPDLVGDVHHFHHASAYAFLPDPCYSEPDREENDFHFHQEVTMGISRICSADAFSNIGIGSPKIHSIGGPVGG